MNFLSLTGLTKFFNNLKETFASINHTHTLDQVTDFNIDTTMSSTSTNPVQNKIVKAALDNKADVELITTADIDAICNTNIQFASDSEVTF